MYTNYFYPEVATTGQILTELADSLSKYFQVTVVCAIPCYSGKISEEYKKKRFHYDKFKNINVIRVRVSEYEKGNKLSRIKHILSYLINCIFITLKIGRQNVVFTVSQPPILGGLIGVWGKFITRGKLIYHIMDFNPEQTIAVGYTKNKLLLKLMMILDKYACKKSDIVVTLGRDMQQTLEKRFEKSKIPFNDIISNWIDEKQIYPLPKDNPEILAFKTHYNLKDKFIIMTSGNIGLYYDFENIIKIMAEYNDNKDIAFVFVGDGVAKQNLIKYTKENILNNIIFIPYQEKSNLIYSLNAADVHIVTNAKGIKGVSVPSKIYGILATNIPIWGILEKGSEAWSIIEESNCGVLAEAGDYINIKKSLDYIIINKYDFVKTYAGGRNYLLDNYTKEKSIEKYRKIINNL